MNIQIQICGLVILVLLILFYRSTKSLRLYSEKIFSHVLTTSAIGLVLDILSVVAIEYQHILPQILVELICKLYIVTLIWMTMYAFSYVMTDLYAKDRHKKFATHARLTAVIEAIVTLLLPISIFKDGMTVYTYGPAVLWVYGTVLINILATMGVIIIQNKKLNRRRVLGVSLWMLIWIVAAVIQFFNNELLIVGFAGALGCLILFAIIENPGANLDRQIGCFNSYALSIYLKRLITNQRKFGMIEVSFGDYDSIKGNGRLLEDITKDVVSLINGYKDIKTFKNFNSNIVVIGKDFQNLKNIGEHISDALLQDYTLSRDALVILVENAGEFRDMDDIVRFLRYLKTSYKEENQRIYIAGDDQVYKYKEQDRVHQKIAEALKDDRVEVFLQPIFSNREKCFTSAEALVRIREKDGTLLSPASFIPVAEANGQVVALGERVLEKVCEAFTHTPILELGIHYIEVNLSVVQCELDDLAERIISIVRRYGVEPCRFNLEITETASIKERGILLENMKKLIEYGFTFSLDDFGKGESNLMYIVDMPVSIVKLDYDMSKAFFKVKKAQHVVRAVVGMAHELNMGLVAEGIETEVEVDGMKNEGIDYIQGYYYSRPLPVSEFIDFIRKHQTSK